MLNTNKKSTAGCKPYDVVMMFKIILLKRFYNLSDEQTEYQINKKKTTALNQKLVVE
ncbi:MAG: transposase [Bacteroidales bacterium]|nr:transposase [Bacteroidales bacterium]MDD4684884.1 transposase [Bacteroidales bacterium]